MRRVRTAVAIVVATAMLSVGGAACTPQQTEGAIRAVGNLITLILFAYAMGQSHPAVQSLPAPTTPLPTIPEPVAP